MGEGKAAAPSSGASRHLLPQGEKGKLTESPRFPSPPVGEGARRAGEGDWADRLKRFARRMRHVPTEAERKMWSILRNRRFLDHKFRRQVPIGPYIADFVCYSARLVIELDGSQHADSWHDVVRDEELTRRGFAILRIWNNDILARPQQVLEAVWARVETK